VAVLFNSSRLTSFEQVPIRCSSPIMANGAFVGKVSFVNYQRNLGSPRDVVHVDVGALGWVQGASGDHAKGVRRAHITLGPRAEINGMSASDDSIRYTPSSYLEVVIKNGLAGVSLTCD
jgi:hypothetical protein